MRKTQLGRKIRRLRQDRGLTQAQMAAELGISASYLNLIEHDERPVTVPILIKLGQKYGVELAALSDDDERRLAVALREVFADAALGAAAVPAEEMRELAAGQPHAARALVALYRAYRAARGDAQGVTVDLPSGPRRFVPPTEETHDFFQERGNHFPSLERAAAEILTAMDGADLAAFLKRQHGIATVTADAATMRGAWRRYHAREKRLELAEGLPRESRRFQLAYQAALLDARAAVDAIVDGATLSSPEAETLVRVGLFNYAAGALLMPADAVLDAARATRHDIDAMARRFGVSFEQICHRLTALARAGGVPFFFLRVDIAGNITKRFSAASFHLSRFGGSCPRLIAHAAFTTPGLLRTQVARLPDGGTFFCLARALSRPGAAWGEPDSHLAITIGCDIGHAKELVYADGLDLDQPRVTEIGLGCRVCERENCRQRAFPPLQHRLVVDERERGASAYGFRTDRAP